MSGFCQSCVEDQSLGAPSKARWKGPDGKTYCSLHFVQRFGHAERLVPVEDYEAPAEVKPPAPKRAPRKKKATPPPEEVTA